MNFVNKKSFALGTSLVVQGLRLYVPSAGDWGLIPGQKSKAHSLQLKNSKILHAIRKKGKATHSSILAWRIPWAVWSMGSQRVGHD